MTIVIGIILAGILASGFMAIKSGREEREIENEYIEQEGQKYIARMYEEKAKRIEQAEVK
ncbi:sporulation YhaL family protein [Bacillus testis]|uniref:sporulation YhaL family protein n=1 Tax=Bacillus testis TaxID=1622072 RepID=UPI00067EFAB7|nr:sporulation YhaL family protein [Bacillus testis]